MNTKEIENLSNKELLAFQNKITEVLGKRLPPLCNCDKCSADKSTFEKLKAIIAEQLNINVADIQMDSCFIDDLGADSLDRFELMIAIEDGFGVSMDEDDVEKIETVREAMTYLKSVLAPGKDV